MAAEYPQGVRPAACSLALAVLCYGMGSCHCAVPYASVGHLTYKLVRWRKSGRVSVKCLAK